MTSEPEFSGPKGRFFAWFLTSPLRRVLEWRMGKPEDRLLVLLELEGEERVLDAGCGSGFHSLLIAKHLRGGHVLSIDESVEMLARLRKNARARGLGDVVEARRGDCLDLDVPDGSMDRAFSAATWHHLDDPARAGRELARVLRPGGRAVVSDLQIGDQEKVLPLEGHDRGFGSADMRRILEDAGLIEVQVETVGRWVLGSGSKPHPAD